MHATLKQERAIIITGNKMYGIRIRWQTMMSRLSGVVTNSPIRWSVYGAFQL